MVGAGAESGGEDAGGIGKPGGVEEQADNHLPAVGEAAEEHAANLLLRAQLVEDGAREGDVIDAQLARGDGQGGAGIVKVLFHAGGVDRKHAVAGGEVIERAVSEAADDVRGLQGAVEEQEEVSLALDVIIRAVHEVRAGAVL